MTKLKQSSLLSILGLLLYVINLGICINAVIQHFFNCDYLWGSMTLLFIILPMVIPSIMFIIFQVSSGKSVPTICISALAAILCFPFVPLGILIVHAYTIIVDNNFEPDEEDDDPMARIGEFMKTCEAMVHLFPQASLQLYIVFQALFNENAAGVWQWLAIITTLTYLAFTISTSYFFNGATVSSKIIFFIFGLLAMASRLVVGCIFSIVHSSMWFVPICTYLTTSIILWIIIRRAPGSLSVPLSEPHISSRFQIFLSLMLTAFYNGFTLCGMVLSTTNFAFAIGGYFLEVPKTIAIISMALAGISFTMNIMLLFLKNVKKDWVCIDYDGESELY
ncbi:unnamed protein product [Meganyctiphanes norvegica]|uniref:XK-related protein n=1 Tax=Meganyctiphanes norvegica TaxID=48144 RepID=A0AAV2R200_MEGNR